MMKNLWIAFALGISMTTSQAMETSHIFHNVTSLRIDSEAGNINITAGKSPLEIKHAFHEKDKHISTKFEQGVLYIKNNTKEGGGRCNFNISIPKDIPVSLALGVGNIILDALESDLKLELESGHVEYLSEKNHSTLKKIDFSVGEGSFKMRIPNGSKVFFPPSIKLALEQKLKIRVEEVNRLELAHYAITGQMGAGDVFIGKSVLSSL